MSLLFPRKHPLLEPTLKQRLALNAHRVLRDEAIREHQMTTLFWGVLCSATSIVPIVVAIVG